MPLTRERQREAHAEYKHQTYIKAYLDILCIHKRAPNRYNKDSLHPVGHLSLLSPACYLKFARFQFARTERNKRLLNMSATPADDVQISPAWNCAAKVVNYFGLSKSSANKNAIYASFA